MTRLLTCINVELIAVVTVGELRMCGWPHTVVTVVEGAVFSGVLLTNELVQTLLCDLSVSLSVGIHSVILSGRATFPSGPG